MEPTNLQELEERIDRGEYLYLDLEVVLYRLFYSGGYTVDKNGEDATTFINLEEAVVYLLMQAGVLLLR